MSKLFLIKAMHSTIFFFMTACLLYILYAGIVKAFDWVLLVALGAILLGKGHGYRYLPAQMDGASRLSRFHHSVLRRAGLTGIPLLCDMTSFTGAEPE
jgi:hypothetical protein